MEFRLDSTVKGTRILHGEEANLKRRIINAMVELCLADSFDELMIPILQHQKTFSGKVGQENQMMMYAFKDRGERDLALAPEYTAVIMQMARATFRLNKDVRVFYVAECFRGENPQAGRYRQFTQFGAEIINPSADYSKEMVSMAERLVSRSLAICNSNAHATTNCNAVRGLDYYVGGKGFEITIDELGAQKQICGGGEYDGGIGFAIGVDRLLLLAKPKNI